MDAGRSGGVNYNTLYNCKAQQCYTTAYEPLQSVSHLLRGESLPWKRGMHILNTTPLHPKQHHPRLTATSIPSTHKNMSLPAPHIQSFSSCQSEWRTSSSNRNVSSPFSLAIPPRSQRRSTQERADTPTQYLDPPENPQGTKNISYLEAPQSPKKAVTVTEKPVRPRPYTLNGASTSTILGQYQPGSSYMRKQEPPKPRINDHVLAFAVTFAIAVLLAIVIPIAAILPQKYIKPLPISVLMPLYIDPVEGTWQRLYDTYVLPVNENVELAADVKQQRSETPRHPLHRRRQSIQWSWKLHLAIRDIHRRYQETQCISERANTRVH